MPRAWPGFAGGAGEDQVVGGAVHAGVEPLGAVDDPVVAVGLGVGFQPGRVRAVQRLGQPERHRAFPGDQRLGPRGALLVGAEPLHHDHLREVPDDRRLVLQVVVQAKAFVRQMLPDDGHVDVGAVAATQRRRQSVAQPAGLVGTLGASRRAGPPTPGSGCRRCPSRCGHARGAGRSTACSRLPAGRSRAR